MKAPRQSKTVNLKDCLVIHLPNHHWIRYKILGFGNLFNNQKEIDKTEVWME